MASSQIKSQKTQIKDHKIAKSKANDEINLLPDLKALELKINQLRDQARDLLRASYDQGLNAKKFLYMEAYERGKICEFKDKIIFTPTQIGNYIRNTSSVVQNRNNFSKVGGAERRSNQNSPEETDSRFLHQQLRELIKYNHQNKKYLLNGEID